MSIEKTNDPPKQDQDDLRLRRFTMGMGIVFFLFTCGGADLVPSQPIPNFSIKVTFETPNIIYWAVYLSTLYALGLFWYRNIYLKETPCQIRKWFKEYGVMVEFLQPPDSATGPEIEEAFRDKISKLDLHIANLRRGKRSQDFCHHLQKLSDNVPSSYGPDFCIYLAVGYQKEEEAIKNQVFANVLKKYFPYIAKDNLWVDNFFEDNQRKIVKIKALSIKDRIFGFIEDGIYILPLLPYLFGFICLTIFHLIPFLSSYFS